MCINFLPEEEEFSTLDYWWFYSVVFMRALLGVYQNLKWPTRLHSPMLLHWHGMTQSMIVSVLSRGYMRSRFDIAAGIVIEECGWEGENKGCHKDLLLSTPCEVVTRSTLESNYLRPSTPSSFPVSVAYSLLLGGGLLLLARTNNFVLVPLPFNSPFHHPLQV